MLTNELQNALDTEKAENMKTTSKTNSGAASGIAGVCVPFIKTCTPNSATKVPPNHYQKRKARRE